MANTTGQKFGGRTSGTPNKTTALLKDAILQAAEASGDTYAANGQSKLKGLAAYLEVQSAANPGPYMSLLGKVLPMQLTGGDGGPVKFLTVYESTKEGENDESN